MLNIECQQVCYGRKGGPRVKKPSNFVGERINLNPLESEMQTDVILHEDNGVQIVKIQLKQSLFVSFFKCRLNFLFLKSELSEKLITIFPKTYAYDIESKIVDTFL